MSDKVTCLMILIKAYMLYVIIIKSLNKLTFTVFFKGKGGSGLSHSAFTVENMTILSYGSGVMVWTCIHKWRVVLGS